MSAQPLLDKLDAWTVEDLADLPDDGRRYEIVDGSLLVSPPPGNHHQGVAFELAVLLREAVAPGWTVITPGSVRFARSLRIPDVLVLRTEAVARRRPLVSSAEEVLLAVEVMSQGSRHEDRLSKPAHYAEAGIPHFWRVEPDAPEGLALHAYRLEPPSTTYRQVGSYAGDEPVELTEPFPLRLVPSRLLPS